MLVWLLMQYSLITMFNFYFVNVAFYKILKELANNWYLKIHFGRCKHLFEVFSYPVNDLVNADVVFMCKPACETWNTAGDTLRPIVDET